MTRQDAFSLMMRHENYIGRNVPIKKNKFLVKRFLLVHKGNEDYGVDVVLWNNVSGESKRTDLQKFLKDHKG